MTEVRTVSSTGGEKGTKRARYDLLPVEPLRKVAEHYGIGAEKYEDRNWERGYEWSKSYAALQRHVNAFWGGDDIDAETGSPHLAAVVFHALALMEWGQTHPEFDDRPKKPEMEGYWLKGGPFEELLKNVWPPLRRVAGNLQPMPDPYVSVADPLTEELPFVIGAHIQLDDD